MCVSFNEWLAVVVVGGGVEVQRVHNRRVEWQPFRERKRKVMTDVVLCYDDTLPSHHLLL